MESMIPQYPNPQKSGSKKLLVLGIALIIVFLVIIGLLVIMIMQRSRSSQTSQTTPTPTESINPVLATVGNQKIYRTTVENAAVEEYDASAIDANVLKRYLDIVIEQTILGIEANQLNLTVTPQDITKYKTEFPEITNENTIRFNILKDKIIVKQVRYVEAYVIGYALPPLDGEHTQSPEVIEQRALADTVGTTIAERLATTEEPLVIAESISNQYPILQPVLGMNGYILQATPNKDFLEKPRKYVYDPRNAGQQFYEALFSLKDGEIKKNVWPNGTGLEVMKAIKVQDSGSGTYDEWLKKKKNELVKYNSAAINAL